MRNLCVSLEDNEVTCPCCLQKPSPSRSMRVAHLRVARFPIHPGQRHGSQFLPPHPPSIGGGVVCRLPRSPVSIVAWRGSPDQSEPAVGPARTRERLTERAASTRRGRHALHAGRRAGCSLSSVNLFRAF
jgi:hypothetical protein